MRESEPNPHIVEEIKFNLEQRHRELGVDPHYIDVVKILLAAGERLNAKAGKIADLPGDKAGVTEEDLRIEQELGSLIDGFQDGSVFFSEEERTGIPPDDAKDVWICDPVSNTISLKEGRAGYAITIAHQREGKTDFSAVYDAARGRMFTAYRGKGAFLNGTRMPTPEITADPPRVAIGKANAVLAEKFGNELLKNQRFGKVKGEPQSVALNTLKILEGGDRDGAIILAKDIFPHFASQLIIQEAGGEFTNLQGKSNLGYKDEIFITAATKELHAEILKFVQDLARQKGI